MTRLALSVALIVATLQVARADEPPPEVMDRIRELHAKGDFVGVRRELLAQYEVSHDPALLFGLGQAELNLGHYAAAIDYYEKFIATSPAEDQVALAQQAIGAARMKLRPLAVAVERPPTIIRKPAPQRRWSAEDSALVAVGGAAIVVGGGLIVYGGRLGNDRDGDLSDYDARVDLARTIRWTGVGMAAGGALLVGVSVLRWRLRPDGDVAVSASVSSATTGIAVTGRW
jgi:tetratricopeptide (TPR) repeat protein